MNCFNHTESVSVAVCQDCQKGLCSICATKYTIPICDSCNQKRKQNTKKEVYKELLITFGVGILCAVLFAKHIHMEVSDESRDLFFKVLDNVFLFYIGASLVAGWKTLTRITPNIFLILPILGWVLFFVVKFILSIIVGVFMFPVRLVRNMIILFRNK